MITVAKRRNPKASAKPGFFARFSPLPRRKPLPKPLPKRPTGVSMRAAVKPVKRPAPPVRTGLTRATAATKPAPPQGRVIDGVLIDYNLLPMQSPVPLEDHTSLKGLGMFGGKKFTVSPFEYQGWADVLYEGVITRRYTTHLFAQTRPTKGALAKRFIHEIEDAIVNGNIIEGSDPIYGEIVRIGLNRAVAT